MGPMQQRASGPPRYATRGNLVRLTGHDREKGKTPSNEALMPDSRGLNAERRVQPPFRENADASVCYFLPSLLAGRNLRRSRFGDLFGDFALELADFGAELVVAGLQEPVVE